MAQQKTKKQTHDKMLRHYGEEEEHKHNKDHLSYREHEKSHGRHLHGGHSHHKNTHHHHKTSHHEKHFHANADHMNKKKETDNVV